MSGSSGVGGCGSGRERGEGEGQRRAVLIGGEGVPWGRGKATAATCPGGTRAAAGVRLQVGDDSGWAAGPHGWASAQSALGRFFLNISPNLRKIVENK